MDAINEGVSRDLRTWRSIIYRFKLKRYVSILCTNLNNNLIWNVLDTAFGCIWSYKSLKILITLEM